MAAMASQIQLMAKAMTPAAASPAASSARRPTSKKRPAAPVASVADALLGKSIQYPPPPGGRSAASPQQAPICSCGALVTPNALFCWKCGKEHPPGLPVEKAKAGAPPGPLEDDEDESEPKSDFEEEEEEDDEEGDPEVDQGEPSLH